MEGGGELPQCFRFKVPKSECRGFMQQCLWLWTSPPETLFQKMAWDSGHRGTLCGRQRETSEPPSLKVFSPGSSPPHCLNCSLLETAEAFRLSCLLCLPAFASSRKPLSTFLFPLGQSHYVSHNLAFGNQGLPCQTCSPSVAPYSFARKSLCRAISLSWLRLSFFPGLSIRHCLGALLLPPHPRSRACIGPESHVASQCRLEQVHRRGLRKGGSVVCPCWSGACSFWMVQACDARLRDRDTSYLRWQDPMHQESGRGNGCCRKGWDPTWLEWRS